MAVIIGFSTLPPITNEEHVEKNIGALKFPQLKLGMLAIFAYVGVEVAIQSNLPALMEMPQILGLDHTRSVHFISLYWGSLMIGRWMGAISAFKLKRETKNLLIVVMPLVAYGVVVLVNYIKGSPVGDFFPYFPFVLILIAGYFMGAEKPAKTLMLFSILAAVMMLTGLVTHGSFAVYCFISGGLFCSIMWPCIFSLSIAGLGKYTNQGSALLIMMILGGALIPPAQGLLGDNIGIHASYVVPVICFLYLAFYGWRVTKVLQKQGISYDGV
jgi:FHS family L-fucose permease-like MFS transporter